MQDDDKIYGLIAQAEDIQRHAVALQRAAQDAIKTLPDASRTAVRDAAREFITEGAEKASRGILDASSEAKATCAFLKRTGLFHGVFLVAVALILGAGLFVGVSYVSKSKLADLAELKAAIRTEEATLRELQTKTWGLELVKYQDGTRGIVLPKGTKYIRHGTIPGSREAVVIR